LTPESPSFNDSEDKDKQDSLQRRLTSPERRKKTSTETKIEQEIKQAKAQYIREQKEAEKRDK
jgi:hypothetical protein